MNNLPVHHKKNYIISVVKISLSKLQINLSNTVDFDDLLKIMYVFFVLFLYSSQLVKQNR